MFVRLNIERVLFNEVLLVRPELRQPAEITNRIEQLVNIKRLKKFSSKRSIKQKHIRELVE